MKRQRTRTLWKLSISLVTCLFSGIIAAGPAAAQSERGSLSGEVRDVSGGRIEGASITVTPPSGPDQTIETDREGRFTLENLQAGTFALTVEAPGFVPYGQSIAVSAGESVDLNIQLDIQGGSLEVNVVSTVLPLIGPNTAARLTLGRDVIDALPNTPGGLQQVLRLLARRTTSPTGPAFSVNGFETSRIPNRDAIREIRIIQDPFSAEYDAPGMSRVDILTSPGSETFHGGLYTLFNDEVLNSRNPFLTYRPAFQSRFFGGRLSGPVLPERASFFVEYERTETDDNAFVNATVVDSSFQAVPFVDSIASPYRGNTANGRVDLQLGEHTLAARYELTRSDSSNEDVGRFALPSVATLGRIEQHQFQTSLNSVIDAQKTNEFRIEHLRENSFRLPDNSGPTTHVPEAFTDGGSESGLFESALRRWTVTDNLLWRYGSHNLKFGGEFGRVDLAEHSEYDFGGAFYFNGRVAPPLDANDDPFPGNSNPQTISITNLEAYRRTLLFADRGFDPAEIRSQGGGASLLTIATGNPEVDAVQYESAAFAMDDWTVRPGLTLSTGLRLEHQTQISSGLALAPRVGVAWAPGQDPDNPDFVIRGGAGVFYTRVPVDLPLDARRFSLAGLQEFVVTDEGLLDLYPQVPTSAGLAQLQTPTSIVRLDDRMRAPRMVELSLGVETALPRNLFLDVTGTLTDSSSLLRSRNVNAPLPLGTPNGLGGQRPDPSMGEVFQYETTGRGRQTQLAVNLVQYISDTFTHYTTYIWSDKKSDTAGADTFPSDPYDLASEYGRADDDARHTLYWGGWFRIPGKIDLTPMVVARSGLPFNITTGRDPNQDGQFTERPARVPSGTPEAIETAFGAFDPDPAPGTPVIVRNLGEGPAFFAVHLEVGRTFTLREGQTLTLSVEARNLFDRSNFRVPVGNLSSPSFGTSRALTGDYGTGTNELGNRRLEFELVWGF